MKLSEMTMEKLAPWVHVEEDDPRLPDAWEVAKNAVLGKTGLGADEADGHGELAMAAIALTSDLIYNPGMHVDSGKVNEVVESFTDMHRRNLLPKVDA